MTSNIFYNYSKISSPLHNPDVLIFLYSPRKFWAIHIHARIRNQEHLL